MNPNTTDPTFGPASEPQPQTPFQPQPPQDTAQPQFTTEQPMQPQPAQPLQPAQPQQPMQPAQPAQQDASQASPFFAASAPAAFATQQPQQPQDAQPTRGSLGSRFSLPPKKFLFIGGGVIIAILIVLAILKMIPGIGGNAAVTTSTNDLLTTTAFFAQDTESELYALFDSEAEKRLTDYTIESATAFINHASVVENKDGQVGVMKDTGEMIIAYGEYDDISQVGTLFEVERDSDDTHQLINSSKKTISIPGNAEEWRGSTVANYVTSSMYRTWQYYEADLHPTISVTDEEGEDVEYVLDFSGKELFNTTQSLTQRAAPVSIYTVFAGRESTYIVDSKAGKVATEIESKTASLIPAADDLIVVPVGQSSSKPDKYLFIKGGSVKKELAGDTCERISMETLPSDGSRVIFCRGTDNNHKLLSEDGSTIAEGRMFYTKDTYLSHKDQTISFHKEGKVVSTLKNCRSWVSLSGEQFTATAAYPVEADCDKAPAGVNYAVYATDGTLIKNGGSEWHLGDTRFNKDGLGIAVKKTRTGTADSTNAFIVSTALEAKAGPIQYGDFAAVKGVPYFISTMNRGSAPSVVYSGDLKTKLYESNRAFKVVAEKFRTSTIGDDSTVNTPIESVIFAQNDNGTLDYFNPETKKTIASGIGANDKIDLYKWYILAESSDDSLTYLYRSGNPVK